MPRRAKGLTPEEQQASSISIHAKHLLVFLEALASEAPVSSIDLETRLGVSGRTIRRYKEALANQGFEIKTRRGQGYQLKYVPEHWVRILPQSIHKQLLSLDIMLKTAAQPSLQVQEAVDTLSKQILDRTSRNTEMLQVRLKRAIKTDAGLRRTAARAFSNLKLCLDAILNEHPLEFDYTDSKGEASHREVDPYGCLYTLDTWYLICHDRRKKALRNFALERMHDVKLQYDKVFPYPADFDIEKAYRGAWGVWKSEGLPTQCEFVVDKALATFFREFNFPSAKAHLQRDGRVRIKTSYADVAEAARWLAPYADMLEVRYPEELKTELRLKAEGILKRLG